MNKLITLLIVLFALSPVHSLGIGYDGTLGGACGLSIVVPVTSKISLQTIGGWNSENTKDISGNDSLSYGWSIGTRAWYTVATWDKVSLLTGLGASFTKSIDYNEMNDISMEIPIGLDYQFTPNFSIAGQFGALYVFNGKNTIIVGQTDGSMFLGAFAFHLWI